MRSSRFQWRQVAWRAALAEAKQVAWQAASIDASGIGVRGEASCLASGGELLASGGGELLVSGGWRDHCGKERERERERERRIERKVRYTDKRERKKRR